MLRGYKEISYKKLERKKENWWYQIKTNLKEMGHSENSSMTVKREFVDGPTSY